MLLIKVFLFGWSGVFPSRSDAMWASRGAAVRDGRRRRGAVCVLGMPSVLGVKVLVKVPCAT